MCSRSLGATSSDVCIALVLKLGSGISSISCHSAIHPAGSVNSVVQSVHVHKTAGEPKYCYLIRRVTLRDTVLYDLTEYNSL
jgi:hypothetical protein